ncbi:MAG: hypothetical protein LBI63_06145 [Candidatus Ancillula sp.]|nr:hypothetical protein [Candidatus Ancillula sp.]
MKAFRFRDKLVAGLFAVGFVVLGGTTPAAKAYLSGDYVADAILIKQCALRSCVANGQGNAGDKIEIHCAALGGDATTFNNKTSNVWIHHTNLGPSRKYISGYSPNVYLQWDGTVPASAGTTCTY